MLATFQDQALPSHSAHFAPISHAFVGTLEERSRGVLGTHTWPCEELPPGMAGKQTVRLHIMCKAAGTNVVCKANRNNPEDSINRKMRNDIQKMLGKGFPGSRFPSWALEGRNLLSDMFDEPLNITRRKTKEGDWNECSNFEKWDNSSMLQIALLGDEDEVVGAALLYLNGPGFGYLPYLAVGPKRRGWGLKFVHGILAVLRHYRVGALLVDSVIDDMERDAGHVPSFWRRAGLERSSNDIYDDHRAHTEATRHMRINASAFRKTAGKFDFFETVLMFRGTAVGWKLSDTGVQLPVTGVQHLPGVEQVDEVEGQIGTACSSAAGSSLSPPLELAGDVQDTNWSPHPRQSGELTTVLATEAVAIVSNVRLPFLRVSFLCPDSVLLC